MHEVEDARGPFVRRGLWGARLRPASVTTKSVDVCAMAEELLD